MPAKTGRNVNNNQTRSTKLLKSGADVMGPDFPWKDINFVARYGNSDPNEVYDPHERRAFLDCLTLEGGAKFRFREGTREQLDAVLKEGNPIVLGRLFQVWSYISNTWKDSEFCLNFMFQAHPALEDRRPVDCVLFSQAATDAVLSVVDRSRYGTAA